MFSSILTLKTQSNRFLNVFKRYKPWISNGF